VVVVALIAYRIAGEVAGWLAGWLWAVEPHIIDKAQFALPDPYVALFVFCAILILIQLFHTNQKRWVYLGVISALAAGIFKYHVLPLMPVVILLPLATRWPVGWRQMWKPVLISGALATIVVGWMLFVYGGMDMVDTHLEIFSLHDADSQSQSNSSNTNTLISLQTVQTNLEQSLGDYQNAAPIAGVGLMLCFLIPRLRQRAINSIPLVLLGINIFALSMALGMLRPQPYRRLYPIVGMLVVLIAVGFAGYYHLIKLIPAEIFGRHLTKRHYNLLTNAAVIILAGLLLLPLATTSWEQAKSKRLRDHRVDIMEWADDTLPAGPYLANNPIYAKVFNAGWGGYQGNTAFAIHDVAPLVSQPIDTWRANGVQYVLMPYSDYFIELPKLENLASAYLDETLLLKSFSPAPDRRGPPTVVLRLYPIREPKDVKFGDDIHLVGYDLSTDTVSHGDTLMVAYYWRAESRPETDFTVYNHLTPLDVHEIVAQADGSPVAPPRRPTSTWDDSGETLIGQPFLLPIDENIPPGEYRLLVGLYNPQTEDRLSVNGTEEDFFVVSRITVQ
jgi:hypothetical protein